MNTSSRPTWKYLAPNPKSSYKQFFVCGTRIPARALYGWYAGPEPTAPEDIAREFNLPLEAVLESIAYCQSNPPELLADYARDDALEEAVRRSPNGRPSPQEIARIHRL
jgi:uncharacterized protein (DUF433 family)